MFQLKLRRAATAATAAALLSALSLLPAQAAAPRSPRPQPARSERNVAAPLAGPFWDLVTGVLRKLGAVINPDGRDARLSTDSNGNRATGLEGAP